MADTASHDPAKILEISVLRSGEIDSAPASSTGMPHIAIDDGYHDTGLVTVRVSLHAGTTEKSMGGEHPDATKLQGCDAAIIHFPEGLPTGDTAEPSLRSVANLLQTANIEADKCVFTISRSTYLNQLIENAAISTAWEGFAENGGTSILFDQKTKIDTLQAKLSEMTGKDISQFALQHEPDCTASGLTLSVVDGGEDGTRTIQRFPVIGDHSMPLPPEGTAFKLQAPGAAPPRIPVMHARRKGDAATATQKPLHILELNLVEHKKIHAPIFEKTGTADEPPIIHRVTLSMDQHGNKPLYESAQEVLFQNTPKAKFTYDAAVLNFPAAIPDPESCKELYDSALAILEAFTITSDKILRTVQEAHANAVLNAKITDLFHPNRTCVLHADTPATAEHPGNLLHTITGDESAKKFRVSPPEKFTHQAPAHSPAANPTPPNSAGEAAPSNVVTMGRGAITDTVPVAELVISAETDESKEPPTHRSGNIALHSIAPAYRSVRQDGKAFLEAHKPQAIVVNIDSSLLFINEKTTLNNILSTVKDYCETNGLDATRHVMVVVRQNPEKRKQVQDFSAQNRHSRSILTKLGYASPITVDGFEQVTFLGDNHAPAKTGSDIDTKIRQMVGQPTSESGATTDLLPITGTPAHDYWKERREAATEQPTERGASSIRIIPSDDPAAKSAGWAL